MQIVFVSVECRVKSELLPSHVQPVTASNDHTDDNPAHVDNDRGQQNRYGGRYRHVEKNSLFDDDDGDSDNEQTHNNCRQLQSQHRLVFICTLFVTGSRMLYTKSFVQSA
jgi:ankyrin repeat protein